MRILFTSIPQSGHLHPIVPIALAAREVGHEVGFAVCASRCPALARQGFAVHCAGADENDPEVAQLLVEGRAEANAIDPGWVVRTLFAGLFAQRMIPDLCAVIDRWRPDLVVSEVTEYASWVVAERYGIPRAMVPFGIYWGFDVLEAMGAGPALAALRRRVGLDPERWLETLREQPCLLFAPAGYQLPGATLPANVHLYRPVVFDQSGDEALPAWIHHRPDRPLVYATLGTAYNETAGILEATADAARDQEFDLVVTVGRNRDPAALGVLPANVRAERYIPQSLLLPHCAAVVSHAGYSTVMAALCHGLPMILTPVGADQPFHAGRCRDLGVALVVEESELTPQRMRVAVHEILRNPSYRDHARGVQHEMMQLPGMDHAVRWLEQIAGAAGGAS